MDAIEPMSRKAKVLVVASVVGCFLIGYGAAAIYLRSSVARIAVEQANSTNGPPAKTPEPSKRP